MSPLFLQLQGQQAERGESINQPITTNTVSTGCLRVLHCFKLAAQTNFQPNLASHVDFRLRPRRRAKDQGPIHNWRWRCSDPHQEILLPPPNQTFDSRCAYCMGVCEEQSAKKRSTKTKQLVFHNNAYFIRPSLLLILVFERTNIFKEDKKVSTNLLLFSAVRFFHSKG